MNACTIVARNYLGQAAVLAESFLEHHPGGSFTTLVIDADRGLPDGVNPRVSPVGPEATGLGPEEFRRMAAAYSVVELATAVKPFLLRTLLANGTDPVTYLDPDIQVFAPLDDISELATAHDIVLTPHLEHPLPLDRRLTDVKGVLLDAGIFNLGFVAVGSGATPFLDWWAGRLARDCIIDPEGSKFVDQRWVALVPGYFNHHVLIDPTINVAWWNLAVRDLRATPEGYTVEGRPLRFFHFSGYNPNRPHLLSSHAGPAPRVLLSDRPGLRKICDEYGGRLQAAGHGPLTSQPYGLASTAAGLRIDARMRRMYREALSGAENGDETEPPNPFAPDDDAAFLAWLREPVVPPGASAPVSRYLRRMYAESAHLPARFPDIDGADGPAFLDWCAGPGRDEEGIASELVPGPAPAAPGGAGLRLLHRRGRGGGGREAGARGRGPRGAAALGADLRPHAQPPRAPPHRRVGGRSRIRHQPDLRERGPSPQLQPRDGRPVPRRALHGGALVVGGRPLPRALPGGPRHRRRGVGGQRLRAGVGRAGDREAGPDPSDPRHRPGALARHPRAWGSMAGSCSTSPSTSTAS